jgi:uncharacterized protein (DUF58 family)
VTKKLIFYFIILVLSLVPAVFTNGIGGYLPFFALLLCGILSFAELLAVKNKIKFDTSSSGNMLTRGDSVPFDVVIENESFLPVVSIQADFFISAADGSDLHTYPLNITLPAHRKKKFSLDADFPHIGEYEAGFSRLVIHDLFDNFRAVSAAHKTVSLLIQPNVYRLDRLPVSTQSTVESNRVSASSPLSGMEYSGVREYAYGDPMKRIQWKLSAHAGDLMTKIMESYTNTGLTIMMDFRVPLNYSSDVRHSMLDGIVECAATVGQYASSNGLDYVLMYTGSGGNAKQCTPESFRELSSWIPEFTLQTRGKESFSDFIMESSRGLNQQSNIVYCTAALTEDAVTSLIQLRTSRKNVIVYYLIPENVYDNQRQELLGPARRLQHSQVLCISGSNAREMMKK